MTGFWTPIFAFIARLFAGWGRGLIQGAPRWLQPHLLVEGETKTTILEEGQDIEAVFLGSSNQENWAVTIGRKSILLHEFQVSKQAVNDIKKIVFLEAARVMPVGLDRLSLSYKIVSSETSDTFAVFIVAMRQKFLNLIVAAGMRHGNAVRTIGVELDDPVGFIKFPVREISIRLYTRRIGYAFAFATLLLLLSVSPQLYLTKLNGALSTIEAEIDAARLNTTKVAGLQNQLRDMQMFSEAVLERKQQGQVIQLLTSLTKASPDDVFLDEIRLEGRRLYLKGQAKSPEKWVINLQRLTFFEKVRLTSVQGGASNGHQRFDLQLHVVWSSFGATQ